MVYKHIDTAVDAARRTFDAPGGWASWEPGRRADVMERFATEMEARAGRIAELVSLQNGMLISISRQLEVGYPTEVLRYYAGLARATDFSEVRAGLMGGSVEVRRVPVGVVAAIVPWNYPQVLSMFKIAPAMAAGCTVVLKPSPEAVLDAFVVAEAAEAAGVPAGVLNVVPGGREAGAHLVSRAGVNKVAFTGSTPAGRAIAETCGRLLRPVTLELGGKSAGIIRDDADLSPAKIGESLVRVPLTHSGRTCHLSTRVLAPRSRYTEVVDLLTELARSLPIGDAMESATARVTAVRSATSATLAAALLGRRLQAFLSPRYQRHLRPAARKQLGRGQPDAARPAGHDRMSRAELHRTAACCGRVHGMHLSAARRHCWSAKSWCARPTSSTKPWGYRSGKR